jgi:hypothetical protein
VSSFSRLVDVETISQQAVVELHRRGVERADAVCAVTDGAEWRHRFVDDHCPTAVRILDFGHAAEYVNAIGQAAAEAGDALVPKWLEQQLHDLKHEGPEQVLTELRRLHAHHPTVRLLGEKLAYLEKREAHMQYPTYHEAGWPIGSGIVESANKRVCALPGTIASVESYLWREKSVNGSVFLGSVARKRVPLLRFRKHTLAEKTGSCFAQNVPVLHVIPVLAANLLWQCGQPLWRSTAILA